MERRDCQSLAGRLVASPDYKNCFLRKPTDFLFIGRQVTLKELLEHCWVGFRLVIFSAVAHELFHFSFDRLIAGQRNFRRNSLVNRTLDFASDLAISGFKMVTSHSGRRFMSGKSHGMCLTRRATSPESRRALNHPTLKFKVSS